MVTVITKTIGAGGGYDYATFTTAEADVENVATTAFGSTDLVANDGAIVFEAVAGTYNESVTFQSTLTTDATRNVTYKPASGSEHGGDPSAGVIISGTYPVEVDNENYTVFDGLHLDGLIAFQNNESGGTVCRNLILSSSGSYGFVGAPATSIPVAPITLENCAVISATYSSLELRATTVAGTTDYKVTNCTLVGAPRGMRVGNNGVAGSVINLDAINNLVLTSSTYLTAGSGTINESGSNNFGGSTNPFPPAVQGTPATITASTAYDPGAGDFALYVGKNGALLDSPNNDVIDQGVGPSVNSDVPTTDILGNARSGATANPGAFEVPQATTIITKTIGPSGDYASFTTAEADVTNIGTSTDLVYENEAIVFEAVAGTYTENVTFSSSLTTDATRNVTYRADANSKHGGVPGAGVKIVGAVPTSYTFIVEDKFVSFSDLEVVSSTSSSLLVRSGGEGVTVDNCILTCWIYGFITLPTPSVTNATYYLRNCVFRALRSGALGYDTRSAAGATVSYVVVNCSAFDGDIAFRHAVGADAASTSNLTLVNCLAGNCDKTYIAVTTGTVTVTGSNNFGSATNPFPASIQGTPYPITATTSFSTPLGSGDYAVYMGATGALANVTGNDVWQQGVGPASNPDVPTTDINGVTRSGTSCNPGAFEADGFVAPTVITKTIGPSSDYASFVTAESNVTNIGTGTDLTFYNEAIVFEAAAGTYTGLTFNSTLTTDATRNVTYKADVNSGHGGTPGAGVRLTGYNRIEDDFQSFIGIEFYVAVGVTAPCVDAVTDGTLFSRCLFTAEGERPAMRAGVVGPFGVAAPLVVRNSVLNASQVSPDTQAYAVQFGTGAPGNSLEVINSTLVGHANQAAITIAHTYDCSMKLLNCLSLGAKSYSASGGATLTLTGSNNFGGSTNPFPVALQGVPYPITPTTDTDPGPGDWAIYVAATGALIDDPDNDVLAGGIGPDANPDVPTTDILGNARSGATTDPGAFEISNLPITIMRQIYQQDASFSVGASSAGVEKITHQLGPGSADYFTINSTTSATIKVPPTAHALRIICVVAAKACDVTLDLDASNSVFLGSIGGVASVQTDLTYFWSFGQVVSDGTYPRVRIVDDGFAGDQLVYLWWHLA